MKKTCRGNYFLGLSSSKTAQFVKINLPIGDQMLSSIVNFNFEAKTFYIDYFFFNKAYSSRKI